MALQLVAVASLLAGPMDYLRPYDKFAGDQKALLEQLERDKAAKSGSPLVPPADEAQDELLQEESAAPEATSPASNRASQMLVALEACGWVPSSLHLDVFQLR